MKLKTREVPRNYEYTDSEAKKMAEEVIEDSKSFIRALTDDESLALAWSEPSWAAGARPVG